MVYVVCNLPLILYLMFLCFGLVCFGLVWQKLHILNKLNQSELKESKLKQSKETIAITTKESDIQS